MKSRIRYIANLENSVFERGSFEDFTDWFHQQQDYQLDIETNVTDWWCTRKLISLQFGSITSDRQQWFLQWSALTTQEKMRLKFMLEIEHKQKLIHNGAYEYIILRFNGIILNNIYDTMLAEKVLRGGMENMDYALADISYKYLRITMDKTLQKSFGDDVITDDKILYAITDVAHLDVIKRLQLQEAGEKRLLNVIGLEMDSLPAFSDITYYGFELDKDKWRENIRLAEPIIEEATKVINAWIFKQPFYDYALAKGYVSAQDRVTINFASHQQKTELLQQLIPGIPGSTQAIIKAYIRDNGKTITQELLNALVLMQEKDYSALTTILVKYHKEWLVAHDFLIPAGQVTINWNSQPQVLPFVQIAIPKISSLGEDERNKFSHQILKDLEQYKWATGLTTKYGEEFIRNHVEPDGKVRTNINQVVSTGRISSSNPNMQNITVDEKVGNRYRNAFIVPADHRIVDSDYVSQELVLIAFISKDPVWNEAIAKNWDIHSICAEMVYKQKWKDGAEPGCAYYAKKEKCKCAKHKVMRYDVKSINFGLAYGMTHFKLAGDLNISVPEAKELIRTYFAAFPLIGRTLNFLGEFGVRNGFIQTLGPFYRKRWFPHWRENRPFIEQHIQQIKNNSTLGEIERASKNMPIQGSSADIVKIAMVLLRDWIRYNGYIDKINIIAQVHDQITTDCATQQIAEMWAPVMDNLMVEAGKVVVPSGILKAETNNTGTCWTK